MVWRSTGRSVYFLEALWSIWDVISAEQHQSPKKIKAITEMPKPQDVTQLCAFLSMVQYYAKFLPSMGYYRIVWGGCEKPRKTPVEGWWKKFCFLVTRQVCDALWLQTAFSSSHSQLLMWSWGCLNTVYITGRRIAHCLCIPISAWNWEEILTNWKGSLIPCLGGEEVPNLPGRL